MDVDFTLVVSEPKHADESHRRIQTLPVYVLNLAVPAMTSKMAPLGLS